MLPPDLAALRRARAEGRLLLFLGADLPREATGLPSRAELARGLAERHGLGPDDSLALVAQRVAPDGQRHAVTQYLIEQLARPGLIPALLHECIAELGLPTIVTTAYDDLLKGALERRGALQVVRANTDLPFLQRDLPCLVRLYGDLLDKRSLVVTEADQERLLEERWGVAQHVSELMRSHVVLFVGEGFGDVLVRRLRRELVREGGAFAAPAFAASPGIDEQKRLDLLSLAVTPLDLGPAALLEQLLDASGSAPALTARAAPSAAAAAQAAVLPERQGAAAESLSPRLGGAVTQPPSPPAGRPDEPRATSAPAAKGPENPQASAASPPADRPKPRDGDEAPRPNRLWLRVSGAVFFLSALVAIPAGLAQIFGSPFAPPPQQAMAEPTAVALAASPVPAPTAAAPPSTATATPASPTPAPMVTATAAAPAVASGKPITDYAFQVRPYGDSLAADMPEQPSRRPPYRLAFELPGDGSFGNAGLELIFVDEAGENLDSFSALVITLSRQNGQEGCRLYLREVSALPPEQAPAAYLPLSLDSYEEYPGVEVTSLESAEGSRRQLLIPLRYFQQDERGAPIDLARVRLIGVNTDSTLSLDLSGHCQIDDLRLLRS